MNFVVIGTDHRMQNSDRGFEGLLRALLDRQYFEPLAAIAEEYDEGIGISIGQRLAQERDLHWYNIDMTDDEKREAGVLENSCGRISLSCHAKNSQNRPRCFRHRLT